MLQKSYIYTSSFSNSSGFFDITPWTNAIEKYIKFIEEFIKEQKETELVHYYLSRWIHSNINTLRKF